MASVYRDYVASKKAEDEEKAKPKKAESERNKQLLIRIRERRKIMVEADIDNRRKAKEDIRFVNVPGEQWDAAMKSERGSRPCYEFNKLRINGKRVINEIRANRPQGKVTAVEGGDQEGAELRMGLVRNIESMSDIDTITDQCAESQVDGGYAVMRVDVQYCEDSIWDQEIKVNGVKDPLGAYSDPACQDILLRRDAQDWCIEGRIGNKVFEERYGDVEKVDFEESELADPADEWEDEETVRIVEYWWKEPHEKELWLIERPTQDGKTEKITVDMETDEGQILRADGTVPLNKRKKKTHKIMMCVASGDAILEGPVRATGTMFPFVPIYGEIKLVDGKIIWHGLHRFSKDAQQVYNFDRTAAAEAAHQASKSQWWATANQAKGNTEKWDEAHRKNYPFMIYNADPAAPGPPARMAGPEIPLAFMNLAEIDAADIRDTSGLHEASFGEESGEKSGVALQRKQNQASIVTYNFPDNMAKARKRVGEIILDYIPHVYDADREIRILGADGEAAYKRINHFVIDKKTGSAVRINDLTAGKYDYTVTTGPSFATQRQEFTSLVMEFAARAPETMGLVGDLFWKATDMPYAQEIAKRWQTILPPPIQQQIAEGKEIPPEAQAAMAQANQAMQLVQEQTQLVQAAAQEVEQEKSASEKQKAEVQTALANLKTAEAQFETKIAKAMADLQKREMELELKGAALDMQGVQLDGRQQQLEGQQQQTEASVGELSEAQKAVAQIDEMTAQFMELQAQALEEIRAIVAEIKNKPRIKSVRMERANGQPPRAVPEYEESGVPA